MPRNSFVQMNKLTNVSGRITYISSKAKQENLYATYSTVQDRSFWRELAKCNQECFCQSGTEGKCIEARELIIALPESFVYYEPEYLLRRFTDHFKQNYKVECISALHHNKRKTNYHIHLIFAERQLLDNPIEKIASRNMFYDEKGKHRRTKKEILDETGNIRKRCKVIRKGEVYEQNLFTKKNELFKKVRFFVYNSSNLNQLDAFSSNSGINVMIINMQAFNTSMKEGGKSKEARIIYDKRDELAKNSNAQIDPSFVKDTLDVIREEYEEIFGKDEGINQFTVTGVQKFAIVQMILAGMNQSVIKEFTGQGDDILEDCQRQVNVEKKIDINRHINFTMRGIETYDIV